MSRLVTVGFMMGKCPSIDETTGAFFLTKAWSCLARGSFIDLYSVFDVYFEETLNTTVADIESLER